MTGGVVANEMPLGYHALDKICVRTNEMREYKKSGRNVLFFENVERFGHVAIFIPRIKGEVHHLFLCLIAMLMIQKIGVAFLHESKFLRYGRLFVILVPNTVPMALFPRSGNRNAKDGKKKEGNKDSFGCFFNFACGGELCTFLCDRNNLQ